MTPVIAPVVEGDGEEQAIRPLVQRIGYQRLGLHIDVAKAHRLPRGKMVKETELCRAVRLQSMAVGSQPGGVLVILDADDDCPVALRATMEGALTRSGLSAVVVAANREYEAWFLAGLPSLKGNDAVHNDAEFSGDPEKPRDAKGHLEACMNTRYHERRHQPAFSALLDPDLTHPASRSFRRLCSAVRELTGVLDD